MRRSPIARAAATASVSSVVLGFVLATAAPVGAAQSATGSVPSAAPGGAVDLALEVAQDGNGPFTPTEGPGADASATNGIVRTRDAITYRVTMTSTGGASSNERFTLTAPTGTSWAGVPGRCTGAGSAVTGQDLTCNLGTVDEGRAVVVPAVLQVSAERRDGDRLEVAATGTADAAANGTVTASSPATTVSAAARYNLSKDVQGSVLRTGVPGPDGVTRGIQLVYPIAVDWQPVVPGQGLLGFAASTGPMTFTDDLSQILGDLPSQAVLWNGGAPACGPNGAAEPRLTGLPGGAGGGERAVADSGELSCSQAGPGRPVDVRIDGTVTDPDRIPTRNIAGGPIVGGQKPYVVSGYISLWMPTPPAGTSVQSTNTYSALQTTSVTGAPNFPGSTEPTADNASRRTIVEYGPGNASKQLYRVRDGGAAVDIGSAKRGDPWATPGTLLRSDVSASNAGLTTLRGVVLCDTFDRATQRLTTLDRVTAWTTRLGGARVQYAAFTMSSPEAGRTATCDDGDGPWYDNPEDVPGGAGAVGAVRATGDVLGGEQASLHSYVTTEDAPNGTRARDFGHVWFGDRATTWVHDASPDPGLAAGPLADSVVLTEDLARITKKVVDPGHDASDTPDETTSTTAGATVEYALYPTFTNGKTTGQPAEVTVQDVLPQHTRYVDGSASAPPVVDTVTDAGGEGHQRLTWTLPAVRPNAPIEPLTYTAAVADTAPPGPITNTASASSPTDASDAQYRQASRAVQVVRGGGVSVLKAAVDPVVVVGDDLRWDLVSTNTDTTPVEGVDVIDVLPHRGDDQGSAFHGSVALAGPVPVDTDGGEQVTYTRARPTDVDLDGGHPSNRPGGSTTWCAETAFGTDGCPATLTDVTAVRIQRTAPIGVGESVRHRVAVHGVGAHDGDAYTNRFGLRSSSLALPVRSNPATVRVVSGAVGDRVWDDHDHDGVQDHGEPGVADVAVALRGTDDRGAEVTELTTSRADGTYRFDGLRPGRYTVVFSAPDDSAFTTPRVGDDRAVDSDAGPDGQTDPVELGRETDAAGALTGVRRDETVDAGLVVDEPGEPGGPGGPDGPGEHGGPDGGSGSSSGGRGADGGSGAGDRAGAGTPGTGALAWTGADVRLPIVLAVVLLVVGTALAARTRRRRGRS